MIQDLPLRNKPIQEAYLISREPNQKGDIMSKQFEFLDELINKKYLQDKTDSPIHSALETAGNLNFQDLSTLRPSEDWSAMTDFLNKGGKL